LLLASDRDGLKKALLSFLFCLLAHGTWKVALFLSRQHPALEPQDFGKVTALLPPWLRYLRETLLNQPQSALSIPAHHQAFGQDRSIVRHNKLATLRAICFHRLPQLWDALGEAPGPQPRE